MKHRFINAARSVAMASEGTGKRNSYKVGAILYKNKNVIAARHNMKKTHTALHKYTEYPILHAESYSILSAGFDNCKGADLLCVRVGAKGNLTMAMPCEVCQKFIDMSGIRRVYYSNWDGEIKEL